ncbi:acylphosphatase [candidate division KSB1 bacterium]|nr:acylphosphatase [candidate division KSB1 bacterium]
MSEIVCVNAVVSGRVQGVGYRFFVIEQAEKLGLGGYVTNLADGRVEALIEGPPEQVDELVRLLHKGPPQSRVDAVEILPGAPTGRTVFRVR